MTDSLNDRLLTWRSEGHFAEVGGHFLYVRRQEKTNPTLPLRLFLHGFPSSSYDWRGTLGLLQDAPTLAFDFLGFGLSQKPPEVTYSLFTQADVVEQLVGDDPRPVTLVARASLTARAAGRPAQQPPRVRATVRQTVLC